MTDDNTSKPGAPTPPTSPASIQWHNEGSGLLRIDSLAREAGAEAEGERATLVDSPPRFEDPGPTERDTDRMEPPRDPDDNVYLSDGTHRLMPRPAPGPRLSVVGPSPAVPPSAPPEPAASTPAPAAASEGEARVKMEKVEEAASVQGAFKLSILGGKGTGKSFLFQALAMRCLNPDHSGALTPFLKGGRAQVLKIEGNEVFRFDRQDLLDQYALWYELRQTTKENEAWYKLRLRYRQGFWGLAERTVDVEFFDASGEELANQAIVGETREKWVRAFLGTQVAIFCLPLWAVFHRSPMTPEEKEDRSLKLHQFVKIVEKFDQLREEVGAGQPVQGILALTMADDERTSLETLRHAWVGSLLGRGRKDKSGLTPYQRHLREVATPAGLCRYLETTRRLSELLRQVFATHQDERIQPIPSLLRFGGGEPWLIPISAVEGEVLRKVNPELGQHPGHPVQSATGPRPDLPPQPVHVELPLLIALCEHYNALM